MTAATMTRAEFREHLERMRRNGRLACCQCGADLGSADDPYRDPDCERCLRDELESEIDDDNT